MKLSRDPRALDPANAVTVTAGGLDYGGWLDVSIKASIEHQAREFTVGITSTWPGAVAGVRQLRQGDRVQVRIGADLVLTGWIAATPVRRSGEERALGIAGKSLTGDLVDCSAINKPGQWKKVSVKKIVSDIAGEYGIEVVSQVGDGVVIDDHAIQPGETAFESIDRLLRLSRLLSTDDERGRLVLADVGSAGRAHDALEWGGNLMDGDAPFDFSECFSEYRVLGQHATPKGEGHKAGEVSATALDPRITRRRVYTLQEHGNMTNDLARQRAEWERDHRMAQALRCTYTVVGWRQSNGALWRVNQVVRVRDPEIGFDRDMLIIDIEYALSDAGMLAKLTVAPPQGYVPEPADPKGQHRAKKKRKKKEDDDYEQLLPADWEKR